MTDRLTDVSVDVLPVLAGTKLVRAMSCPGLHPTVDRFVVARDPPDWVGAHLKRQPKKRNSLPDESRQTNRLYVRCRHEESNTRRTEGRPLPSPLWRGQGR